MPIPIPISRTKIATAPWGIPITNEVNRLTTQSDSNTSRVTALETATSKTAWQNLTLTGGWVNYDGNRPAQIRRVGDMVYVRGVIKNGTMPAALFTIPTGFRPQPLKDAGFIVNSANGLAVISMDATAYVVQVVQYLSGGANTYIYLDPLFWSQA